MTKAEEEGVYIVEDIYIDIISELNPRYAHILDKILHYLSVRELCLICCVSKSWRKAVTETSSANNRRIRRLKRIRKLRRSVGQENWPIKKKTPVPHSPAPVATAQTHTRNALSDSSNIYRTLRPRLTNIELNTIQTPNTRDMRLRIR